MHDIVPGKQWLEPWVSSGACWGRRQDALWFKNSMESFQKGQSGGGEQSQIRPLELSYAAVVEMASVGLNSCPGKDVAAL